MSPTTPACKHSACLGSMLLYEVEVFDVSMHAMLEYMQQAGISSMRCLHPTSWHVHAGMRRTGVARPASTLHHWHARAAKPGKAGFPACNVIRSRMLYGLCALYNYS